MVTDPTAAWAAAYAQGASLREIAAEAGCDNKTICRRLAAAGVVLRRTGPRGYTEITPDQVAELLEEAGSARAAAELLGVSRTVVRSRLAKLGMAADPHGKRTDVVPPA